MSRGLLIDTCGLVKWAAGDMPMSAQEALLHSGRRYVSVISAWEVQLKPELRSRISSTDFDTLIDAMGLELMPLESSHVKALESIYALSSLPHKDPFDHILIAQALAMDWAIRTCDERFKEYPRVQVLW